MEKVERTGRRIAGRISRLAISEMDDSYEIKNTARHSHAGLTSRLFELLEVLLSDAASDVEVVARDLGLKDEMRERLWRAFDRVRCAQGVLEAMREAGVRQSGRRSADASADVSAEGRGCGGRDVDASEDHGRDDALDAMERVRGAVELLAGDWPQHYPEGAVEWRILDEMEQPAG